VQKVFATVVPSFRRHETVRVCVAVASQVLEDADQDPEDQL
jgi:hypothetical protein